MARRGGERRAVGPDGRAGYARAVKRLSDLFRRRRRGRVLAVKWGYNPNSSSLGVDVTFLLLGMAAIALLTPLVGLILRFRRAPRV